MLALHWMDPALASLPVQVAALSVPLSIFLWVIAYDRFQIPIYLAFFYPISLALFFAAIARSIFQTPNWKGRQLDYPPARM